MGVRGGIVPVPSMQHTKSQQLILPSGSRVRQNVRNTVRTSALTQPSQQALLAGMRCCQTAW
jgi:hypothetical protein